MDHREIPDDIEVSFRFKEEKTTIVLWASCVFQRGDWVHIPGLGNAPTRWYSFILTVQIKRVQRISWQLSEELSRYIASYNSDHNM